jgi:hypothetical protein
MRCSHAVSRLLLSEMYPVVIIITMDSLLPLHLVLDIDHTLLHTLDIDSLRTVNTAPDVIHKSYNMRMYYRPGLKEFLDWAFKHCLSVSLWTAGESIYARLVSKHLSYSWRYVYCCDDCVDVDGETIKPLSKMWAESNGEMNQYNTLVVDDTPITYSQNILNSVHIPRFKVTSADAHRDIHLHILPSRIQEQMKLLQIHLELDTSTDSDGEDEPRAKRIKNSPDALYHYDNAIEEFGANK